MTRKLVLLLFGFAISIGILASDFEVRIVNYPKEVPLGAPVETSVLIKNISGHPIVIAKGHGGFRLHLNIRRADGQPRKGCKPNDEVQFRPGFIAEKIPKDWSKETLERILCDDDPGEWIVSAELTSTGPYPKRGKGQIGQGYIDAWDGRVVSNEVHIKIVRPTGIDQKAYNLFKGCPLCDRQEVLKLFPTSTYAAYQVYKVSGTQGMAMSNPQSVTDAVASGSGLMGEIWVPVAQGGDKNGLAPLSGEVAVQWRKKWINIILTNHPDIWFADQLRLKRAVDQVALKNYQAGASDLEALTQEATPEVAQKAQKMLDMMKSKGWIKKQPEAPKQ